MVGIETLETEVAKMMDTNLRNNYNLQHNLVKPMKITYNKGIIKNSMEGDGFMVLAEAVKTRENSYTVENAMNVLLSKLDEALDDVEHGRVLDEAELWDEIDAI